ncbi:MAG: ABC transporter ATP-binding protein [Acidobacteriota bacterium]
MLEVRRLTKVFSIREVVSEVTFKAYPGQVLGYLGPNGAGKSTTVKMLTGLLEPTSGDVFYDGHDIWKNLIEYKRRIGYLPESPDLYGYLSAFEYLQLVGRLRGLPARPLEAKINELLRLFSLFQQRRSAIASYSKGMRQKVLISVALLHNPELLIFDEPLSGLDVTSALVFKNLVQALAREGKTIIYCSHVLEVVERLCSRVIILHEGRVVADDSVNNLRSLMSLPSLEKIFTQLVIPEDTEAIARQVIEVMKY